MEKIKSINPKSKHSDPNIPDLEYGTPVTFEALGEIQDGYFSHWTHDNNGYLRSHTTDKPFWRRWGKFKVTGKVVEGEAGDLETIVVEKNRVFEINKRFGFLQSLVKMTVSGSNLSLIITGDGGLGKTYTVMQQVEAAGLEAGIDYHSIKGYSTAKGLYNTLYEHQDKLIIFDDCDEVLLNDTARNILKGALDSYDERIVHWVSQTKDESVPTSFEFTGRIIFISNMKRTRIPQALISRSTCIDVSMTTEEKIQRMTKVLAHIGGHDVSMEIKQEALAVIEKWKDQTDDLNFRTLMKVINIRKDADYAEDWEEMAEYMLLS